MLIFVAPHETEILNVGIGYLRIEGVFYCGIGILFLLYGYYPYAGNVCNTDHCIARNTSCSFLLARCHPLYWSNRHLVVYPHRMVYS